MSIKSRLSKLELASADKVKPWLWNGSPVGRTPPQIVGMMVRCERAARGEIALDAETADELKWLDGYYSNETCKTYLEYCDWFVADFEANY